MCGGRGGGGMSDAEEQQRRAQREARERHDNMVWQQTQQAKQFRQEMPNLERDMGEAMVRQSRSALASDLQGAKVDASRRGLLNSRLAESREAGLRAEFGANLAGARADYSRNLRSMAQEFDEQASQAQLAGVAARQQMRDQAFADAMRRIQQRQAVTQQALQLGGVGAGFAASRGAFG